MTETPQGASPEAGVAAPVIPANAETETPTPPVLDPVDPEYASEVEGIQKKFNKLTEHRRSAERRAEAAERQSQALTQLLERDRSEPPRAPEPVRQPQARQTLADFQYDEVKYQTYLAEDTARTARETMQAELKRQQDADRATRRLTSFKEKEAVFAKTTPDYNEVAHYAPISNSIGELVMELDEAAQVAYHLGKNPELALKLNALPREIAALQLGRMEAELKYEREKAAAAVKKVSQAPPPPPKVEANGEPVDKDPKDWTPTEFAKWRKKHM